MIDSARSAEAREGWLGSMADSMRNSCDPLKRPVALALLGLLFVFHVVVNGLYLYREDLPPSYDPAHHLSISLKLMRAWSEPDGGVAKSLLEASSYYPPLPHFVTSLVFALSSVTPDAACASLLFWMLLLIVATYESGRILFDRAAGLLAAAIVSLYPIAFGLSRAFYPDLAVLATCALTLACFLKSDTLLIRRWALLFGLSAGLAQMTKWTAFLFWIGAVVAYGLPQLIHRVETSKESIEKNRRCLHRLLAGYLIGFILFAWLFDAITDRVGVLGAGYVQKLFLATALFHSFLLGALLFNRPTRRWIELYRGDSSASKLLRKRIINLFLAILLAMVVCLPWYVVHGPFVLKSTVMTATTDAAQRGFPSIGSADSVLKYLFFLENHQIHLFFFLLFLLSLVVAGKKARSAQFPLLFGFAVAYFAMTCVRLKDPRFTMPFLYLIALITGGGLLSIPNRGWKWTIAIIAVGFGIVQCLLITFGLGLSPENHFLFPRYGEIALFKGKGYGSYEVLGQHWPVQKAVRLLAEDAPADRPKKVFTLVNHHCVHYEAFNFYARVARLPVRFAYPLPRVDGAGIDLARTFAEADALVVKRGGYLGPGFSIQGLEESLGLFLDSERETLFGFRRRHWLPLPDGTALDLWVKEEGETKWKDATLDFGGLGRLLAYQLEPASVKRGEKASLRVKMNLSKELARDYHLFIHLYDPGNRFLGSFGGPVPIDDASSEALELEFALDTSRALDVGLGQLALGVWNPTTGARLPITDFSTGQSLGDIAYLEAFTEIRP